LVLLLLIGVSCEYKMDWEFENPDNEIVIDALITDEYTTQVVTIYNYTGQLNGTGDPVSGVDIILTNGIDSVHFTELTSARGYYYSDVPYGAYGGQTYQLIVSYNGNSDTAYAQMGAIEQMDPLAIVGHDSTYYRINYINSPNPSMTEVSYNWQNVSNYCVLKGDCYATETFYTLRTLDIIKEFAPSKEIIAFPRGTSIVRRKYSLSEAHQKFIRSLLIETEWRGGIFDIEQGNVPSNFHYGIKGWFGVCMVLEDSTYFD